MKYLLEWNFGQWTQRDIQFPTRQTVDLITPPHSIHVFLVVSCILPNLVSIAFPCVLLLFWLLGCFVDRSFFYYDCVTGNQFMGYDDDSQHT